MRIVSTRSDVTPRIFEEEIRPAMLPVLMKGLVAHWPIVAEAARGDGNLVRAITANASSDPVTVSVGAPEIDGCFHYREEALQLNFERTQMSLGDFMAALVAESGSAAPRALAVQGMSAQQILHGFTQVHPLALLPPTVPPRMWIGNAVKVATHNDELENIACCAAGRRRFTLFPPEQVGNLYMGPFELTPGGTPISMVHVTKPDLTRYPRFADALDSAQVAEMEPGDALYIPYQWYHHVESLNAINILVNYWWDPARQDLGSPWDALLHGMIALRNLPEDQRLAWKATFDHYVFLQNGDPGAHLPKEWQGLLGENTPDYIAQLKRDLHANLDPQSHKKVGPLA